MSKNNKIQDGQPYSENQNPQKEEKVSKARKAAAVVFGITAAAVIVILLIHFISNPNETTDNGEGDFVVRLDPEGKANHFGISTKPGGTEEELPQAADGVTVLRGNALGNAWPTSNAYFREKYNALIEEKGLDGGLSGSNNFADNYGQPAVLVYTFYLTNTSKTEPQTYRIAARLTHDVPQPSEAKGVNAYEYLRLGLFMGDNGKEDDDVRYFANHSMEMTPLYSIDSGDYRECLSGWSSKAVNGEDGSLIGKYHVPTYSDTYAKPNSISVCEAFEPGNEPGYEGRGLFDLSDLSIAPDTSRRLTFVAYLEGSDPDCKGAPPENQQLGFSLHIGL